MSSEEKTEAPTAHKLREARKRGEVAFSRDLAAALGFAVLLVALWMMGAHVAAHLQRLIWVAFDFARQPLDVAAMGAAAQPMLMGLVWIVLPLFLTAAGASLAAGLMQTRGVVSAHPFKIDFGRMNPGKFLEQVFSTRQALELLKMLLKFGLLFGAILWVFRSHLPALASSMYGSPLAAGVACLRALGTLFSAVALLFLALGLVDYGHQLFEFFKQQRMSKSERKREYRDNEGDPHLKGELRAWRQELLESSVKPGLGRASVLVTNPTHFAVALFYEQGVVDLPLVVAKGEDGEALRMRAQAREQAIPVLESPPLARNLYATVPVGASIGEEHLEAVAEVFRWVNRLKCKPQDVEVKHDR